MVNRTKFEVPRYSFQLSDYNMLHATITGPTKTQQFFEKLSVQGTTIKQLSELAACNYRIVAVCRPSATNLNTKQIFVAILLQSIKLFF
jgi:hypothetical protein